MLILEELVPFQRRFHGQTKPSVDEAVFWYSILKVIYHAITVLSSDFFLLFLMEEQSRFGAPG